MYVAVQNSTAILESGNHDKVDPSIKGGSNESSVSFDKVLSDVSEKELKKENGVSKKAVRSPESDGEETAVSKKTDDPLAKGEKQARTVRESRIPQFKRTGGHETAMEAGSASKLDLAESGEVPGNPDAELVVMLGEHTDSQEKTGESGILSRDKPVSSGKDVPLRLFSAENGKTADPGKAAGFILQQEKEVLVKQNNSRSDKKRSSKRRGRVFVQDLRPKQELAKTRTGDPGEKVLSLKKTEHQEDFSAEKNENAFLRGVEGKKESAPFQAARTEQSVNDKNTLYQYLKEQLNSEIVKNASVILREKNSGEIRLVLKPERLGNVRIQLNLQDNHIAGKIFVENNIVREVFEQNLQSLYRAFRESGFDTAGLDVNVGSGRSEAEKDREREFFLHAEGVRVLDENVPTVYDFNMMDYAINLVV